MFYEFPTQLDTPELPGAEPAPLHSPAGLDTSAYSFSPQRVTQHPRGETQ